MTALEIKKLTITKAVNPVYSKPDHSSIDCDITLSDGNTYPYTAVANDSTDYGVKLWDDLLKGAYGPIAPCPSEVQNAAIRAAALSILDDNDRVAIRCVKAGIEYPDAWRAYDAELREAYQSGTGPLPAQPDFPEGT